MTPAPPSNPGEKRARKRWIKVRKLPPTMILDGLRVRYRGKLLGYLHSAWSHGIWIAPKRQHYGPVERWSPPGGKALIEVVKDLEVEVSQ